MFAQKLFRRPTRRHRDRSAVATVELAFCLPALIVLTIGTLDVCSMMFLKESVTLAAYEGARQGVGRGHTNADCIARINEFLDERNITYSNGDHVAISGPGWDGAATLENITVTVTVPAEGNLIIPSEMFGDLDITSSVTMRKEYQNLAP